jgi:multiple sugar transport system ATP-binding protein
MADIALSNVHKVYGHVVAVKDINLSINDREFVVLVGPSGCGKSTTLRMIAGLEEISAGTIAIGGRVVNHLQPKDRDIAMVFQNYALYRHMSVRDNLAFGLRNRRVPAHEIAAAVSRAARILSIEPLLSDAVSCATPKSFCSTSHCRISTRSCARKCGSSSRSCACEYRRLRSSSHTIRPRR